MADRRLMRVLLISLYHPELVRGGSQQVCYELFEELKSRPGIHATLLASADMGTPAVFKPGARITGFDERPDEYLFLSRDYDYWWHKTGEPLLVDSFIEFLQQIRPGVVHFHHFLTYGIDMISVVRRTLPDCRIVFTFHEFLAICAADGHMVRRLDQTLCDRPSQVRCHQCFPDRSPEDFFLRKLWFQQHLAAVDHFTCPSAFMIPYFVDWGIDPARITCVPNGQRHPGPSSRPDQAGHPRNRFAFFGQIVDAKGVHILLRAVSILRRAGFTDFRVEINGDNLRFATPPIQDEITSFLAEESQRPAPDRIVVMNGPYHPNQLHTRMARIDWCIVPSLWRESFALVVSEAWMFGKPVICSNLGAPAERVTHNHDGLHFEAADPHALAETIRRACTEPGLWQHLRDNLPEPPTRQAMADGYIHIYNPNGRPLRDLAEATEELLPPHHGQIRNATIYTNIESLNPALGHHIYTDRTTAIDAVHLCKLPRGTLLHGRDHFLLSCRGTRVTEQTPPLLADATPPAATTIEITEDCFLALRYGIYTWGHWLGELLPRIVLAEQRCPGRFRYVLPWPILHDPDPALPTRQIRQSLQAYGIAPDRILAIDPTHDHAFASLYAIGSVWSDHLIHPAAAAHMRAGIPTPRRRKPRRILLDRTGPGRRVDNMEELWPILCQNGFTRHTLESLSFAEQTALFQSAGAIVSVLGSDLTGLLYAREGIKVISLAPANFGDRFFYALIADRNGTYADIRGPVTQPSDIADHRSNFRIDPAELQAALSALQID